MAQPPRLKSVLIIVVGVVALTIAAVVFRSQGPGAPVEVTSEMSASQSNEGTPQAAPAAVTEIDDEENPDATRRAGDSRVTAAAGQPAAAVFNQPEIVPRDLALAKYKASLWADIRANPPELLDLDDPEIDADLAYRIYTYYGNCSVMPRTARQVDQRLGNIADHVEHAGGRGLQRMERRVDRIMSAYELCLLIPPDVDCRLEAVHWLTKAVQLGHDVAEIQFYDRAMGFILRPDQLNNDPPLAMLQPGLVYDFQDTARLAFARALEKGHPEAYLAKSQALLEGLIYPKNPLEAYAHARAAELAAARVHLILEDLDYWKKSAAQHLTEAQLAEAESLALELQSLSSD
jgi:TPR repeat protein